MKVSSKELFEVVRQVVRDELKKALPEMIARHLSEQYIRKALAEQVVAAPTKRVLPKQEYRLPANIKELVQGEDEGYEEEEIPRVEKNDHMGIYEPENPLLAKRPTTEVAAKLLSRNNPMSHIYEGLAPMEDESEAERAMAVQAERQVVQMAKATGMDFSHMNALVDGLEKDAKKKKVGLSERDVEKDLERKRRLLEVPVRRS